ncbi:hypothetical protein [Microbacterium murale]|uniref:hypothetical protein n=1 Tax=Microbacterium murale TaxID=1081040 RepID=UPI0027D87E08|nr:hypothetical protein [Microbacterium murale]
MSDEDLFEQARTVNLEYKAAVAEVQLQILDGDWRILGYGDAPSACGDGSYQFDLTRGTPEGWRIDGTPAEAAHRIGAWLDENGWTDIKTRTYTGDVPNVAIQAAKPDAHVQRITIDFSPGELFDSATVYADSTCEPGDAQTLSELTLPGTAGDRPELQKLPPAEHPAAPPIFGYNEDGTARYWPDESE